jgi:hypothetical protein
VSNNKRATVAELIDMLGGSSKVAREFGIGPSAVSNWKRIGRFPSHSYFKLTEQLKRKGIEASPALWGMRQR